MLHRLREPIQQLLEAGTIEEQRAIYEAARPAAHLDAVAEVVPVAHFTLTLLGVPWPQRDQITTQYPGGRGRSSSATRSRRCCASCRSATTTSGASTSRAIYTPDCCPEYLKQDNFDRLRERMPRPEAPHDARSPISCRKAAPGLTPFVLLDHMDWMSCTNPQAPDGGVGRHPRQRRAGRAGHLPQCRAAGATISTT